MKKLILQFLILGLATAAFADEQKSFLITTNQAADVKQKLEAFDKGEISLEEATEPGGEAWGHELVNYYVIHTNEVTIKMKLPISRCYAAMGKYSEAAKLAQEYVNVYSNDWHGWRILGGANYLLEDFKAAVNAYTNAVRLGDDGSYAKLAFAAMKSDQDDLVGNLVPQLLVLKNSVSKDKTVRPIEIEVALVLYSLRTNQKSIFIRAIEGVNPKDILAHDDFTFLVNQGCKQFKGTYIDKIRQELGLATSSTNSVSSPAH
jgi:tetratricopeptide (TPR) repeat protein